MAAEASVKAACEQRLLERFDTLESKLNDEGPWALGDHFTAVDAFLFHWCRAAKSRMKLEVDERYPKWARVHNGVGGLDACKKALVIEEAMKIDAPPWS